MTTSLNPRDSAGVAAAAYVPLNTPANALKATSLVLSDGLLNQYDVQGGSVPQGVAGRSLRTNFGFAAMGKGKEQGNIIICIGKTARQVGGLWQRVHIVGFRWTR